MSKRDLHLAGIHYRADREALVRDGGDGAGWWYAVRVDPKMGRVIDRTVPDGHFRSMRECHAAIATHAFRLQTAAPGHGWTVAPKVSP